MSNQYVLDNSDHILSVGPDWDGFALANDAPTAIARYVIGRPLWNFVHGLQTRSYLNALMFSCRTTGLPFQLHYRCDAPHVQRLFELVIHPGSDGTLTLDHTLTHTETSRAEATVVEFSDHYDATRCSVCCAFEVGDEWIDVFDCPDANYIARSFGICPTCRAAAQEELARVRQGKGVTRFFGRPPQSNT